MIGLIIYPTYIEYQPRLILKAISKGIPVITTTACGISSSEKVTVINTKVNIFIQKVNMLTPKANICYQQISTLIQNQYFEPRRVHFDTKG